MLWVYFLRWDDLGLLNTDMENIKGSKHLKSILFLNYMYMCESEYRRPWRSEMVDVPRDCVKGGILAT